MPKLSANEIKEKINNLENWNLQNTSIQKEFVFKNFSEAVGFIVQISIEAEKMNHHPDVLLHSWNKVKITISTHSEGGLTDKDFTLANNIQKHI
jgi:4a-hydroxytetrahydrobiopterin dehydratase